MSPRKESAKPKVEQFTRRIRQSGGSSIMAVPSHVMRSFDWTIGTEVSLRVEGKRLIVGKESAKPKIEQFTRRIRQASGSSVIVVPSQVLHAIDWTIGTKASIRVEGKRLIVEKA